MSSTQFILTSRPHDGVLEIRFNCPERLNAIDEDVLAQMNPALAEAATDPEVRVVLLSGEGRAFCAGANYKKHVRDERTMYQKREYVRLIFDTVHRVYAMEKPVIAAVQGIAAGAGAELAVNCDFILMSESAEIWFPEIGLGTFVGCGVTILLPRLVGLARAREILLLGERVKTADAVAMGLATRSMSDSTFRADVLAFAERLAQRAPVPVRLAKHLLNTGSSGDYGLALIAEREAVMTCMMTEDWKEGVRAYAEKRNPSYSGR